MHITIYSIITIIVLAINLLFLRFILPRMKESRAMGYYVAVIFIILGWQIIELSNRMFDLGSYGLLSYRVSASLTTFIGFYAFLFISNFLKQEIKKIYINIFFICGLAIVFLSLFTDKILKSSTELMPWGRFYIVGEYHFIFLFFISGFFLTSIFYLFKAYIKTKERKQKKIIRNILIGFFIATIGGSVTDLLLPFFNIIFVPLGGVFSTIMLATIVIAIYKFKFLDIRPKRFTIASKLAASFFLISSISVTITIIGSISEKIAMLYTGITITVVVTGISLLLTRFFTRPIYTLTNGAKELAKGNLAGMVNIRSRDEFGDLARVFNETAKELARARIKASKHSLDLEKKVNEKTKELNKALDSAREDKKDLERHRQATLNILEDISDSKEELEELNQRLEARGSELSALKDLSDELTSVLDTEEVVVIANSYFDKLIDFSTINYLIINPAQDGSIIYNTYSKEAVSKKYVKASKDHLANFLSLQKDTNLKASLKTIKNIEPKYYGVGLDNSKNTKPVGYEYYYLSISEKHLGVIQVAYTEKRKISKDELSLLRAIVTTLSLSIDRLQTLVLAQHSKTASLVESLTDGVIMFNDKEDIVLMNPAFSVYTGFSREYFDMTDLHRLLSKYDIKKMIVKALGKGEISHINEVALVRHFYEIFITPVRDNKEQIVGGAIIFHDITFLKEIDKMKTEFVAVASHQLRTPLTAIKLFTDMMLRGETGKMNKEQKEYLENINESTERMVRLVNDLLNVSRIESGRLRVEPQEVKLKDLLKNIIAEAKPLAATRQQIINFDDKEKKILKVKLDQNLVRQVFHNLIVNAIRYSPEKIGKISVVLSRDNNKTFTVAVHDNGMGIPKEAQKRIFEKFYRADNAIKSITEGTGLGLYVSKMIVESSGGKIWFESAKGKGTSFYVRMPIKGMEKKAGERGLAIS